MSKYLLIALIVIAGIFVLLSSKRFLRPFNEFRSGNATPMPVTNGAMKASHSPILSHSGIALGVYEPAADPLAHGAAVDRYTAEVGKKPALAWFSVKWQNQNGQYTQFDPQLLEQFRTRGIMPGLTWDASAGPALNTAQPDFSWQSIASGKHDAYITQTAQAIATYRYPFVIRTLHEMDGNWYPWGYRANDNNNPADYVVAWKHIVTIFRKEGATNVQFAWVVAEANANLVAKYGEVLKQMYPGDDYVDWVGMDGYSDLSNNGRSLQDVFQPTYQFIRSFTSKPFMFFEVGATENPNDPMSKANWITQGFLTTIPQVFPDVKVVNWFNAENDKHTKNYAIDSSQNSLNVWKQVVNSPLYQGSFLR